MCYSMLDRAHTHTPHSLPILILRAEVSYETAGMIPVQRAIQIKMGKGGGDIFSRTSYIITLVNMISTYSRSWLRFI